MSIILRASAAVLIVIALFCYRPRRQTGPSLPPGPKPLPIVGNLRDLPPKGIPEYQHWLRFKDEYGPISSITVLGTTLVIIHDKQILYELLEKLSTKTSARPYLHFASLCGWGEFMVSKQYNAALRQDRKLIAQQLGSRLSVAKFRDAQDVETHRFLLRILENPAGLMKHIKSEASAIILKMTYGYTIEPRAPDPLILLMERMMKNFSLSHSPLAWPVDLVPALKYLPEWTPGVTFKSTAREWNKFLHMTTDVPYAFVKQQMTKGAHRKSYVSSVLEQNKVSFDETSGQHDDLEKTVRLTAAAMYAAGSDTSVSSVASCILAMVLFPKVQQKAQQEIDAVVGEDRLPQFEDRERLPYVNAVVKESLRWLPVVPMGITHAADEEIVYAGVRIPKGAYLLPGVWWFLHDPSTYSDPSTFDPNRYLEPRNEPDPASDAFGYGRRICPGRHFADESLFLTISRLLATFNITKAVDEQGKEIEPTMNATPGVISHPVDFPYDIKPRSAKHADLIRAVEVVHPWKEGDAGLLIGDFAKDCAGI